MRANGTDSGQIAGLQLGWRGYNPRKLDPVISDVKADDGVIDAIIRADSRDDDMVPARAEV
jgi:hypothetical protein